MTISPAHTDSKISCRETTSPGRKARNNSKSMTFGSSKRTSPNRSRRFSRGWTFQSPSENDVTVEAPDFSGTLPEPIFSLRMDLLFKA